MSSNINNKSKTKGTNRKISTFPTPPEAVFLDDLVKVEEQTDLEGAKFLIQTPSGFRSADASVFLEQFQPLIGSIHLLSCEEYDHYSFVPCWGGVAYAQDFIHGLNLAGERLPKKYVFKSPNGDVSHIRLPDLRDKVPQSDPSLSYGEFQREGVSEEFVGQFDDYREIPYFEGNKPRTINAGNFITQHKSPTSVDSAKIYINQSDLGSVTSYGFGRDDYLKGLTISNPNVLKTFQIHRGSRWMHFIEANAKAKESRLVLDDGRNTILNWTQYNNLMCDFAPIIKDYAGCLVNGNSIYAVGSASKITTQKISIKSTSTPSLSGVKLTKLAYKISEFMGVDRDRIMVGSKTRENTFNVFYGMCLGALKKTDKKKYYVVDDHGRGYGGEPGYIWLVKSPRGNAVGLNDDLMQLTEPTTINPYALGVRYKKRSPGDPFGYIRGFDKLPSDVTEKKVDLLQYFETESLSYWVGGVEFKFKNDSDNNLVIYSTTGGKNEFVIKISNYAMKTPFKVRGSTSSIIIQGESPGNINKQTVTTPTIKVDWDVRGDVVCLSLYYDFKGVDNNVDLEIDRQTITKRDDLTNRPVDSIYFNQIRYSNSYTNNIGKALQDMQDEFPRNGIINDTAIDVGYQNYKFFFQIKKANRRGLEDENCLNLKQSELANIFEDAIRRNDPTGSEAFYNTISNSPTTNIATLLNPNDYFLMEGKKIKFHCDFTSLQSHNLIGFKAVHGDNEDEKEAEKQGLYYSRFHNPVVSENADFTISFSDPENFKSTKSKQWKTIKFERNSDSDIVLAYLDNTNPNNILLKHGSVSEGLDESNKGFLYMMCASNVVMICFPGYKVDKLREKFYAWKEPTGADIHGKITIAKVKEIMGNLPFFLANFNNRDQLIDNNNLLYKGYGDYQFPEWNRIYLRLKN